MQRFTKLLWNIFKARVQYNIKLKNFFKSSIYFKINTINKSIMKNMLQKNKILKTNNKFDKNTSNRV